MAAKLGKRITTMAAKSRRASLTVRSGRRVAGYAPYFYGSILLRSV
jgi:hypothetical protein